MTLIRDVTDLTKRKVSIIGSEGSLKFSVDLDRNGVKSWDSLYLAEA